MTKTRLHFMSNNKTRYSSYNEYFSEIFSDVRKFSKLIIVSAYWDSESIKQVIQWAKSSMDFRYYCRMEIYLNKPLSPENIEILKRFNRTIRKNFTHDSSGIYVFLSDFVHVKGYLVEGKTKGILSIGSNNLTQNSLNSNDEAFVCVSFSPARGENSLVREYESYIQEKRQPGEESASVRCSPISNYTGAGAKQDLVSYLLEGRLWNDFISTDPYSFRLNLPSELLKKASPIIPELDGYVEARNRDSLNVKQLVKVWAHTNETQIRKKIEEIQSQIKTKSQWRNYTIETNFGHWAPRKYDNKIFGELEKTYTKRSVHEFYKQVFLEFEAGIEGEFTQFIAGIANRIRNEKISVEKNSPWYIPESEIQATNEEFWSQWLNRWRKHTQRLISKLDDREYIDRIDKKVVCSFIPDMRSEPDVLDEFVRTFIDSYEFSKAPGSKKVLYKENAVEVDRLIIDYLRKHR